MVDGVVLSSNSTTNFIVVRTASQHLHRIVVAEFESDKHRTGTWALYYLAPCPSHSRLTKRVVNLTERGGALLDVTWTSGDDLYGLRLGTDINEYRYWGRFILPLLLTIYIPNCYIFMLMSLNMRD